MKQPIKLASISSHLKNEVDLFICSASFEERSEVMSHVVANDIKPKSNLVFYSENESETIYENAKKLNKILSPNATEIIALNTDKQIQNALAINKCLDVSLGSGIKTILLETTTFTHETLLVLFRLLIFKKDLYKHLYISYVGAKDYSINEEDPDEKWLSSGISDIRTIIGYPGVMSPARDNHLIVLFGFESDRTKSLIEDLQFDTISLGFGSKDKSIDSRHYELNYERHSKLMGYYRNAHKFELSLINPYDAKKSILKQIDIYPNHNTVIAPMNNKISTIGAALVSIENPKVQLIYAKAIKYNVTGYSEPRDDGYLFKIF